VDEGDYVKKGSRIATVLATTIEQALLQAKAALVAAKAQEANLRVEFERAERLFHENAMSQQQYDAAKTQYESVQAQVQQAEAALTSARSRLDDATITAPISGIIGKRYYEAGDMANPSLPLVKIVQMKRVKIEFNATEEDLGKLAVGQEANITVKAFPGQSFAGSVSKISPILDPTTRMAEVEVLVDNEQGLLKPGMYAEVEVITGIIDNVIVIPRFTTIESTALQRIEGKDRVVKNYYVFVVDSNRAVQKKLDILYANHQWLAVKSGVEIGDQLVVAGQNNLREGLPVLITEKEEN
jgi:membrane fusion protein (multidrug efflux system)